MSHNNIYDDKIERALIERIAAGDKKAFHTVYDHFYNGLFYYAHKLTGNREEAEDITIRAFVKLYEHVRELQNETHMRRWLYITVRNASIDFLKKQKYAREQALAWQENITRNGAIEEEIIEQELIRRLHEAINALPEQRKRIFQLIYIDGYKAREVAAMLNISENTVNTQKKRALAALRNTIPSLILLIAILKK